MNLEQIRPKAEEYYDKTIYEPCKEKHLVDDYGDPIVCEEDVIDAYMTGITENEDCNSGSHSDYQLVLGD